VVITSVTRCIDAALAAGRSRRRYHYNPYLSLCDESFNMSGAGYNGTFRTSPTPNAAIVAPVGTLA
jgi:hypothetical protein